MNNYRILHLEDDPYDVELVQAALTTDSFSGTIKVVSNKKAFCEALKKDGFDIVLIDCSIPYFNGLQALKALQELSHATPAVIVSGMVGDEQAVKYIKQGAVDYVLKDNLIRLPNTIERAILESQAREKAKENELIQQALVSSTQAGMFKVDELGNGVYVNQQLSQLTGFSEQALLGQGWLRCILPEDKERAFSALKTNLKRGESFQFECRLRSALDDVIWVRVFCDPEKKDGELTGYFGTVIDITEFKKMQHKLEEAARIDFLTGLPNRLAAHETLNILLEKHKRGKLASLTLFYMDLDCFKKINDTLGHQAGDFILQQASERFKKLLRDTDFVARIGGDEFIILLEECNEAYKVNQFAERILRSFQRPFMVDGEESTSTISIGIMHIDRIVKELSAIDVMKHGDQAMYRAKARGRNRAEFYTQELNEQIQRIVAMEQDIRRALKKKEFSLVYQPQLDAITNKIIGCEVLIRWNHPIKGFILPDLFIPIAEEANLINPITEWVASTALKQLGKWIETDNDIFNQKKFLSINLSATQIDFRIANKLITLLESQLERYKIDPTLVVLEITETAVMSNVVLANKVLNTFTEMGFSVSLDDFGTGYTSLSHLKSLPLSVLKIDKSFIQDLENPSSQAITRSILSVAKALNLQVIAEGVETKAQTEYLKKHGCIYMQGYYYAKPMPAKEFEKFIKSQNNS
ncbi:EAL domain-containing protein [Legionella yabuuchiae]|uniref:EAL domain-containing protein n=1 Tax=Legionella yabuuchiae TaxID=376727 RepID=UPI0010554216|nr:EAL domain-containing protein [Legionella yabuuchiae]